MQSTLLKDGLKRCLAVREDNNAMSRLESKGKWAQRWFHFLDSSGYFPQSVDDLRRLGGRVCRNFGECNWVTRPGELRQIGTLEDSHLLNCVAMRRRSKASPDPDHPYFEAALLIMLAEVEYRGLREYPSFNTREIGGMLFNMFAALEQVHGYELQESPEWQMLRSQISREDEQ